MHTLSIVVGERFRGTASAQFNAAWSAEHVNVNLERGIENALDISLHLQQGLEVAVEHLTLSTTMRVSYPTAPTYRIQRFKIFQSHRLAHQLLVQSRGKVDIQDDTVVNGEPNKTTNESQLLHELIVLDGVVREPKQVRLIVLFEDSFEQIRDCHSLTSRKTYRIWHQTFRGTRAERTPSGHRPHRRPLHQQTGFSVASSNPGAFWIPASENECRG